MATPDAERDEQVPQGRQRQPDGVVGGGGRGEPEAEREEKRQEKAKRKEAKDKLKEKNKPGKEMVEDPNEKKRLRKLAKKEKKW